VLSLKVVSDGQWPYARNWWRREGTMYRVPTTSSPGSVLERSRRVKFLVVAFWYGGYIASNVIVL
jgi:hypothetical protein